MNSSFFPVPETIEGNTLTATVVDLNAWVEYEFRVLAKNSVGVGEPSPVSVRTRTEDAGMVNTFISQASLSVSVDPCFTIKLTQLIMLVPLKCF